VSIDAEVHLQLAIDSDLEITQWNFFVSGKEESQEPDAQRLIWYQSWTSNSDHNVRDYKQLVDDYGGYYNEVWDNPGT